MKKYNFHIFSKIRTEPNLSLEIQQTANDTAYQAIFNIV